MTPDHDVLDDAMDHLTPHETEPRDWADVLRRADRGRGHRWVVRRLIPAAGLAVAGTVLAILFVRLANPEEGTVPATEPLRFATLERPQRAGDQVLFAAEIDVDSASVRRARTVDGTIYFLARSKTNEICIRSLESGDGGTTACGTEDTIRQSGAMTMDSSGTRDGASTFVGVVPDGVTRARAGDVEVPVTSNVYVLSAPDGGTGVQVLTPSGWQNVGVPVEQPNLAALNEPQEERDKTVWRDSGGVSREGLQPGSTRLLRTVAGVSYFVGQRRDGAACLLKDRPDHVFACGTASLSTGDVVEIAEVTRDGVATRVGLVADGVTKVRLANLPDVAVAFDTNVYSMTAPFVPMELRVGSTWRPLGSSSFSILSRRTSGGDALPPSLLALPIDHGLGPGVTTDPASVRRVGTFHGTDYWTSGGSVSSCLHAIPDQGGCVAGEDSFNRGALIFEPGSAGSCWTRDLAGLVEDGFDTATVGSSTVVIVDNVFAFDGRPDGSRVTLIGPGKTRVVALQGNKPK